MKNLYKLILIAITTSIFATGCSTTDTVAERERDYQEIRAEMLVEHEEKENARLADEVANVPDWVLRPPRADATGIYAVGIGESKKLRTSMNSARLQGEFGLAKAYKQEISGSERSYEQDNGGESVSEQYTALIDKLVERVPVVGFEVIEQEVMVIGGKYSTFVLLKLPYDEFNAVLRDQRRATHDDTIVAAFDSLEKRIDKRRDERRQDASLAHQRKIEATEQAAQYQQNADTNAIERLRVEKGVDKPVSEAIGK